MALSDESMIRNANIGDVSAICAFGEAHIRSHYAPLIGSQAADQQVRRWWNEPTIAAAVTDGLVVVAEADQLLIGVGQRGRNGTDHVVYKLYVHPDKRNSGVGRRLLDALVEQLPADTDRIFIEHFASNHRAGTFYDRNGYLIDRIEPSPTGDPSLAQVWRVRTLV